MSCLRSLKIPTLAILSVSYTCVYVNDHMCMIGASLSEPHTSWITVCMSVMYTVIMNEKMQ